MKDRRNRRCGDTFSPNNGGIVLSIEFDKRILNDLRNLAEEDGLGSIYQEIRNACYSYVNERKGKTGVGLTDPEDDDVFVPKVTHSVERRTGIVGKIGSLLKR